MRVALVYDLRDEYRALGFSEDETAEFDSPETISALMAALTQCGAEVDCVGSGRVLAARLVRGERFDLVFSIAEGLKGRSREAQVPALCELFDQPYAFSDPLTMAVTLDKAMAKHVVRDAGIPTAPFKVLKRASDARGWTKPFPAFVKPVAEGTGKGCEAASKVSTRTELEAAAAGLLTRYNQPVLVEAYLPGREFTVGIVGNDDRTRVIGAVEIIVRTDLDDGLYSFRNKELCEEHVSYHLVNDYEARTAADSALSAYRILGCRDAARIDFRCDVYGVPHFLEANPIAGLHPTHSDLPILAAKAGWTYEDLIGEILMQALARYEPPSGRHAHGQGSKRVMR